MSDDLQRKVDALLSRIARDIGTATIRTEADDSYIKFAISVAGRQHVLAVERLTLENNLMSVVVEMIDTLRPLDQILGADTPQRILMMDDRLEELPGIEVGGQIQAGAYSGPDRRKSERRTGAGDRRESVRFEPDKAPRRSGRDRRKSDGTVWDGRHES